MSELYVLFCYVQLFLIRASIIARKEMAMRLLDVCWRDDAGPECAIEGSRIELCAVEGSLVSNMCAGGKDRRLDVRWRETWMVRCVLEGMSWQTAWRNPPAHTKNRKMGRHSLQHTLILGVSALDCENGRLQNFPGLSSQLNSRDSRLF